MEEMRRIHKHVNACVNDGDAVQLFPIFHQPALTGCVLTPQEYVGETSRYVLDCQGVNGASGTAELAIKDALITGELVAKMGGKNMTFSQYINAKRIGNCFAQ